MNERIKELAEQAGLEMCGCGCDMPTKQSAKFAELIVDECCLKLLDMGEKTNGIHNYYKHAALELKRHFGVKE